MGLAGAGGVISYWVVLGLRVFGLRLRLRGVELWGLGLGLGVWGFSWTWGFWVEASALGV